MQFFDHQKATFQTFTLHEGQNSVATFEEKTHIKKYSAISQGTIKIHLKIPTEIRQEYRICQEESFERIEK